jgi:hypothetical protein
MSRIKITLDKNYNFVENKSVYNDDFVDAVDLISKAQSDKVITENEANLLFKIVLKKEFKKEVKNITPLTSQTPEIRSFFMNMKSKQIKHA